MKKTFLAILLVASLPFSVEANEQLRKAFGGETVELKDCVVRVSRYGNVYQYKLSQVYIQVKDPRGGEFDATVFCEGNDSYNNPNECMTMYVDGERRTLSTGYQSLTMDGRPKRSEMLFAAKLANKAINRCSARQKDIVFLADEGQASNATEKVTKSNTAPSTRSGDFTMHSDNPKRSVHSTQWTGSCSEGGAGGVWVNDDMPNIFSWSGYSFPGSKTGSAAGIGIESAMRKACSGQ